MSDLVKTNIEWIGYTQSNWKIGKILQFFYEGRNKNVGVKNQNLLSLSYGNIVEKDINTSEGLLPASFSTYNIVDQGDIIIRPTDLQNDKVSLRTGLVKEKGIITSAYIDLKPYEGVNSNFFHKVLHSYDVCKVFYNMGSGVRQGIGFADIANLIVFVPPLEEQKRIADFLDGKCAQIDEITKGLEEKITKLQEYQKEFISEAVTKGIDRNTEYKESGVSWIGAIPSSWSIKKLKYITLDFDKGYGITKDVLDPNGDIRCIRYADLYTKYDFFCSEATSRTNKIAVPSAKQLRYGDVLFACTGELIEEIGKSVVYLSKEECLAGGDIAIVRHSQCPRFMGYALASKYVQDQKSYGKFKLKVVHIHVDEIKNLLLALPLLEEQKRIADFLDGKCAQIDEITKGLEEKITKLQEYQKEFISEAVTKGIDRNTEYKESGVSWIGAIPSSWSIKKLKYITLDFDKGYGITKDVLDPNGDIRCIRYADLYTKYDFFCSEATSRTNKIAVPSAKQLRYGDVLFACTGELIEEIGKSVVYLSKEECLAGGDIAIVRHSQCPRFMGYALASKYVQDQKSYGKFKLKVVHIHVDEIKNLLLALPLLEEQKRIADFLDGKCAQIDEITKATRQEIETLKQYKQSLIYEYVTGKKEVPNEQD